MQAVLKRDFVTIDDYLAGEDAADVKHEYVGGAVYAMAGASREHNLIALNIAFALRSHLKGKPCRVFVSDVKVNTEMAGDAIFYYPDVMVGCDKRDTHPLYLSYPKLLVEVSSESTERSDRREKFWAHQNIDTLEEYLIAAQDRIEVTLFRRSTRWKPQLHNQLTDAVKLSSIKLTLPLASIYEGVLANR